MSNLDNWKELCKNMDTIKLHAGELSGKEGCLPKQEFVSINFRMPSTLRKIIQDDLRTLEDNKHKLSLNDYLLHLIIIGGNIGQNANGEFFHRNNKQNLTNYFDENKKTTTK